MLGQVRPARVCAHLVVDPQSRAGEKQRCARASAEQSEKGLGSEVGVPTRAAAKDGGSGSGLEVGRVKLLLGRY